MPFCFAQAIQFWKWSGVDLVAVHLFAAEFGVAGVQVEAVSAGNEGKGLLQIGAQLVRRAGLAGIIAGGDQPAAQRRAEIFKPADVIALPAMEGNGNARQRLQGVVNVHADGGITFPGGGKGFPGPVSQVHGHAG